MLVRIQLERWLPDGCYYIPLDGFSGQRQSTAPVRLRKEGSRGQLLKWQSITYLRICVMLTNEIRMRQSAIRVQAHREVEPNSSQSTWDVPRPVRFDSDVRKRAYCRSQQIGDHESNSGRWHRGVTTYSPCCWHSPANRIPKGRTEKGETDRPFTVADLTATSG